MIRRQFLKLLSTVPFIGSAAVNANPITKGTVVNKALQPGWSECPNIESTFKKCGQPGYSSLLKAESEIDTRFVKQYADTLFKLNSQQKSKFKTNRR